MSASDLRKARHDRVAAALAEANAKTGLFGKPATAIGKTAETVKGWKAEALRLRAGIEAFLAGDYPNPRSHRPDNCEHGTPYYEECSACDTAHFLKLLAG
jgi:hypothetical protein